MKHINHALLHPSEGEVSSRLSLPSSDLALSLREKSPAVSTTLLLRQREQGARAPHILRSLRAAAAPPIAHAARVDVGNRVYAVRFSSSGNSLAAATQSSHIAIVDVTSSLRGNSKSEAARRGGTPRATIIPENVAWTVTNVEWLNEDTLLYSSMHESIHLARLPARPAHSWSPTPEAPAQRALSLKATTGRERQRRDFGIFSFAIAPGSVELAAATTDGRLVLYDIEASKISLSFDAHKDDINAVCFAAGMGSGSDVMITGSDDGLVKVFDRRALSQTAAVLAGHRAGVTSVDARGDGVYICSNGKDQACRIFDIRRAVPQREWQAKPLKYSFDYRWELPHPRCLLTDEPGDASVATLRGHAVLRTLIRARWSPYASTAGRFIASGSACGATVVWDVGRACGNDSYASTDAVGLPFSRTEGQGPDLARDVSWHPDGEMLASSCFSGAAAILAFSEADGVSQRRYRQKLLEKRRAFATAAAAADDDEQESADSPELVDDEEDDESDEED